MVRRAQYLYVHCVTDDGPAVVPAYPGGALYIDMVPRLVKRRPREDTVSLSIMAKSRPIVGWGGPARLCQRVCGLVSGER